MAGGAVASGHWADLGGRADAVHPHRADWRYRLRLGGVFRLWLGVALAQARQDCPGSFSQLGMAILGKRTATHLVYQAVVPHDQAHFSWCYNRHAQ